MNKKKLILCLVGILYVGIYAYNAALLQDDLFLVEYLPKLVQGNQVSGGLKTIFFSLDLPGEYRLYGLSRIIHLLLALSIGTQACYYGIFLGISQLVTGWVIYRLLRGFSIDFFQALVVAFIWIFSPFSVTFCFHHYSYLILPFQITVVAALVLQQLLLEYSNKKRTSCSVWLQRLMLLGLGCCIAWTGESHLPLSVFILGATAFFTPSKKSSVQRITELMIVLAPIIFGVIFHRFMWMMLIPKEARQQQRYHFSLPKIGLMIKYFDIFFVSLWLGIKEQLVPIVTFVGNKRSLELMSCIVFLSLLLSQRLKNFSFLNFNKVDHAQIFFSCHCFSCSLAQSVF